MPIEHSLKGLAARLSQVQEKRKAILEKAEKFAEALKETFGETEIYGISADVTLEETGYDEYVYGRLGYNRVMGLTVAYRTTDEDHYDNFHGTPDPEQTYTPKRLTLCSPQWLERLFVEENLLSLLDSLNARIDEIDGRADQSLGALEKMLAAESAELNEQMIATLMQVGNEPLGKSWSTAHAAVNYDPADSLTRSSSFLESACTRILRERGIALPQTKTMATLLDASLAALDWPAEKDAQEDVKKITGGLKSISLGISSLRTHFGTAHGASADQVQPDGAFAKLANNASAAVAIFLLNRHLKGGA
ncbi:abortive infection family protein [Burkholderia ambifaria]|uniref:abortive infection family protein n=1 Tax=Burkholderia ambifaria TaxID=152480 RepID=UPI001E608036|nr:abortive infection family protein [Burkholderia ambifaria]UEP20710.1 abortive infection family protein [Burkholderia ambifaria]